MVKFFVEEDFPDTGGYSVEAAYRANTKLEREGRVVIGSPETDWNEIGNRVETHKALLINVELIQKCSHPVDKVNRKEHYYEHGLVTGPKELVLLGISYECSLCGNIVKPTGYGE
jgi:hypothetical protein